MKIKEVSSGNRRGVAAPFSIDTSGDGLMVVVFSIIEPKIDGCFVVCGKELFLIGGVFNGVLKQAAIGKRIEFNRAIGGEVVHGNGAE